MSDAKISHTIGPWSWGRDEDGDIVLGPGVMILGDWTAGTPFGDNIDRANAYLIAAAPDLLAALKAIADLKGWTETPPVIATGIQVMNAIAKAEGR